MIILSAVIILLLFAIGIFNVFLASYRKSCADMRAVLVKADEDLIGERIEIGREDGASVEANLYIPDSIGLEPLSVVFNIHGGEFVGGDEDVLDTQRKNLRGMGCDCCHGKLYKSRCETDSVRSQGYQGYCIIFC